MQTGFRCNAFALAAALAAAMTVAVPAGAMSEDVVTRNGVSYVSGGVGEDSVERLQAMSKDYNLQVIFALKAGNYVADVPVVVTDARGVRVIDTVTDGPWLLVRLPPGAYRVSATFGGESLSQAATVGAAGRRELVFRFAHE